jgi:hypothetical protein
MNQQNGSEQATEKACQPLKTVASQQTHEAYCFLPEVEPFRHYT